jgi:hypothetical protein
VADREHLLMKETAFWKNLLDDVAKDMESTAKKQVSPEQRRWCERRAKRIRELLEDGMPPRWTVPLGRSEEGLAWISPKPIDASSASKSERDSSRVSSSSPSCSRSLSRPTSDSASEPFSHGWLLGGQEPCP